MTLKTFSFPNQDLLDWLAQQPNQSAAVREGVRLLRKQSEEEPFILDKIRLLLLKNRSLLLEIRHELKLLREKAQ